MNNNSMTMTDTERSVSAQPEILQGELEVLAANLDEFVSTEAHRAIARKMILWLKTEPDSQMIQTVREIIEWKPELPMRSVATITQIKEKIIQGTTRFIEPDYVSPDGFRIIFKGFGWKQQEMVVILEMTFEIADGLYEAIKFLRNEKVEIDLQTKPESKEEKIAFDQLLSTILYKHITGGGIDLRAGNNQIDPQTGVLRIPLKVTTTGSYYDLCTNAVQLASGIKELREVLPKAS